MNLKINKDATILRAYHEDLMRRDAFQNLSDKYYIVLRPYDIDEQTLQAAQIDFYELPMRDVGTSNKTNQPVFSFPKDVPNTSVNAEEFDLELDLMDIQIAGTFVTIFWLRPNSVDDNNGMISFFKLPAFELIREIAVPSVLPDPYSNFWDSTEFHLFKQGILFVQHGINDMDRHYYRFKVALYHDDDHITTGDIFSREAMESLPIQLHAFTDEESQLASYLGRSRKWLEINGTTRRKTANSIRQLDDDNIMIFNDQPRRERNQHVKAYQRHLKKPEAQMHGVVFHRTFLTFLEDVPFDNHAYKDGTLNGMHKVLHVFHLEEQEFHFPASYRGVQGRVWINSTRLMWTEDDKGESSAASAANVSTLTIMWRDIDNFSFRPSDGPHCSMKMQLNDGTAHLFETELDLLQLKRIPHLDKVNHGLFHMLMPEFELTEVYCDLIEYNPFDPYIYHHHHRPYAIHDKFLAYLVDRTSGHTISYNIKVVTIPDFVTIQQVSLADFIALSLENIYNLNNDKIDAETYQQEMQGMHESRNEPTFNNLLEICAAGYRIGLLVQYSNGVIILHNMSMHTQKAAHFSLVMSERTENFWSSPQASLWHYTESNIVVQTIEDELFIVDMTETNPSRIWKRSISGLWRSEKRQRHGAIHGSARTPKARCSGAGQLLAEAENDASADDASAEGAAV